MTLTKQQRLIKTLAESKKDKTMTRKVDTYEYESLETCIQTEQVPPSEIEKYLLIKHFTSGTAREILHE